MSVVNRGFDRNFAPRDAIVTIIFVWYPLCSIHIGRSLRINCRDQESRRARYLAIDVGETGFYSVDTDFFVLWGQGLLAINDLRGIAQRECYDNFGYVEYLAPRSRGYICAQSISLGMRRSAKTE